MSLKLTRKEEQKRKAFAIAVINTIARLLKIQKLIPKKELRTNKKTIKQEGIRKFLEQNPQERDRIYNALGDRDSRNEEAIQDVAASLTQTPSILNYFYSIETTPQEQKQQTPAQPPASSSSSVESIKQEGQIEEVVEEAVQEAEAEAERVRQYEQEEGLKEIEQSYKKALEKEKEKKKKEKKKKGVKLISLEEVQPQAQAPTQAPTGDVQQDIISAAQLGAPTQQAPLQQTPPQQTPPQQTPPQQGQAGGVRGLGLSQEQINRLIPNTIADRDMRSAISIILNSGTINFNELISSLGTSAFVGLMSNILSSPVASVFVPIIRKGLNIIISKLGLDFDKFFKIDKNNNLVMKELIMTRPRSETGRAGQTLRRSGFQSNLEELTRIREALQRLVSNRRINENYLTRFDEMTYNRYFINTEGIDNPGLMVSPVVSLLDQFITDEGEYLRRITETINKNNFVSLGSILTKLKDVYKMAPVSISQEIINNLRNYFNVPYGLFILNSLSRPEEQLKTDYERLIKIILEAQITPETQQQIISAYAETLNNIREINRQNFDIEVIVPPTAQQIETTIQQPIREAEQRGAQVSQALRSGAIAGAGAAGLSALYRGEGLQSALLRGAAGGVAGAGAGLGAGALATSFNQNLNITTAAGIAGGALVASQIPKLTTTAVQTPPDFQKVIQQDEKTIAKGTLRPKFIVPSVSILDNTENEIQADFDEFSMFDFVIPSSEGVEGTTKNNPLKRSNYLNELLILNGGGIDIDVPLGELDLPQKNNINNLFIYDLPEMVFNPQEYNLSEYEITPYDPYDDRLQIEILNPYKYYSRTEPYDISRSVLFSRVP